MINTAISCQNEIKLHLDSKRVKFAKKRNSKSYIKIISPFALACS